MSEEIASEVPATEKVESVTDFDQATTDSSRQWGRLKHAAAFSLFRDLHINESLHRKHARSDYKVYDLNNRVV
ncbi:hypothetical protein B9Z55_014115 [Caenorhabditis nigoni]|uniref:Uncharacterized protein n=1 Tax=Caenorhabditis nigoni TaxID=1611254 RepID=A0A2G5U4M1_9PELO|nr:hypothetical protein B9Z55_014115 [Caenorhabditis nigoni]